MDLIGNHIRARQHPSDGKVEVKFHSGGSAGKTLRLMPIDAREAIQFGHGKLVGREYREVPAQGPPKKVLTVEEIVEQREGEQEALGASAGAPGPAPAPESKTAAVRPGRG